MAKAIEGRGLIWALFFLLMILALLDVLSSDSVIVDFFAGPQIHRTPFQGTVRRILER